ncbi:uncharacterized protein P174DRAFT_462667 [Aspergillus novofumigatus IBT 16806]|uniref:DUF7918 domain-containing protein n=1 Tax=Aspergillus novofumigatus (strain IBT 16806) TaxID=1392255 RepID=A0A2I1C3M7_ASPN1|nr:uncharacterized protein P174DRAFT_462667 [Aspergillus novofumigatus IBT 16806]PKX92203.1 hypothetical protein P174DRAFT_462667 [Aspergillus novofumigatus IBT 16806]
MPCFKGLAVSIHTPDGPIPEYSIQRQSRASRIACYIPVPPPKLPDSANGKPEQSTFAISITLLNPGQDVPYSTPKPTPDNPSPKPKVTSERGQYTSAVSPYQPLTNSPNETVAAYIYFDGRQKEEVATLLRRGEETWVNSRWVSVPESEGGGLAEREFLFREVGLERWLNGLDLEGKDVAARIERRRQKMERRRLKRESTEGIGEMETDSKSAKGAKGIMRYGNDEKSPLENVSDDDMSYSDSDDDPIPESAGQIKVALFRVLASGEIKRGEYSPQFDAHDDDEDNQSGQGNDADIDHTTSFAKPKTLDPKTISTQTVTGIDPSDKPYAIFTFMYRGERQLQKMGILKDPKSQETPVSAKRRSLQTDFSIGFLNFRDKSENKDKKKKNKSVEDDDMESEDDDDDSILGKADDEEAKEDNHDLTAEDIKRQGELAEGVRKIKLKRQHSSASLAGANASHFEHIDDPPNAPASSTAGPEAVKAAVNTLDGAFVGSPLKKQRASVSEADESSLRRRMESGLSQEISGALGSAGEQTQTGTTANTFGGSLKPQGPALQQPALQQPALQQPALQQPALQQPAPQQPALQQADEDEEL